MTSSAQIGHNAQLPYDEDVVAALEARVRELADAGGDWLALKQLGGEDQASKLNDFLAQSRAVLKEIEVARKAAKDPIIAAGKAVDSRFKTLAAPVEKLGVSLKKMLDAFLAEKQRRLDEERRAREAEARRAAEEAERARREAEARNDVIAAAKAEEEAKAAAEAAKAAEKQQRAQVSSATGGGKTMSVRVTYSARITDDRNLLRAVGALRADPESREKLVAEVERLCTALRRRKDGPEDIPGVEWIENRSVS